MSVHYWPVSRPGLVWRLVTAPEVEVYQEVITTLQYTHFTGAQAQRNNIKGRILNTFFVEIGTQNIQMWWRKDNVRDPLTHLVIYLHQV